MENRIMSFTEFNSLYESYGFINESSDAIFDPGNPTASDKLTKSLINTTLPEKTNEGTTVNDYRAIMKGEKGDRVKQIQKYLAITPADGVFGAGTEAKVKEFQKKYKLTIDGKVGIQTLRKMMELNSKSWSTLYSNADEALKKLFINVKTGADARKAGVDPKLLLVFDKVVVTKMGDKTYVICYPKKDAAKTVNELDSKGLLKANWEWVKKAASAVGKALLYTATGVFLIAVEAAAALISGLISGGAFIIKGVISCLAALVQGIATVADWAWKGAKSAYNKVSEWTSTAWNVVYTTVGKLLKSSLQGLVAFIDGIKSAAKTIGYVLTGAAIKAWQGIKATFGPAIKTVIEGVKDAAAFVKKGMAWIVKNVSDGAKAFGSMLKSGWNTAIEGTKKALKAGAEFVEGGAKAIGSAIQTGYSNTVSFFTGLYDAGKSFWESEEYSFFYNDILLEGFDFSLATDSYSFQDEDNYLNEYED